MALINCPECGAQVSDQALSCPSCGHPLKLVVKTRRSWQPVGVGWMATAIIVVVLILFTLLNTCNWQPV